MSENPPNARLQALRVALEGYGMVFGIVNINITRNLWEVIFPLILGVMLYTERCGRCGSMIGLQRRHMWEIIPKIVTGKPLVCRQCGAGRSDNSERAG